MITTYAYPVTSTISPWILRCTVCGDAVKASLAEALRYGDSNWPRCCGETMTLVTPETNPTNAPKKPPAR